MGQEIRKLEAEEENRRDQLYPLRFLRSVIPLCFLLSPLVPLFFFVVSLLTSYQSPLSSLSYASESSSVPLAPLFVFSLFSSYQSPFASFTYSMLSRYPLKALTVSFSSLCFLFIFCSSFPFVAFASPLIPSLSSPHSCHSLQLVLLIHFCISFYSLPLFPLIPLSYILTVSTLGSAGNTTTMSPP